MQKETTLSQIAKLPQMSPPELRALWRELFGSLPPQVNRAYLQRRLAYRMQELAMDGSSASAVDNRLAALDKQSRSDRHRPKHSRYLKLATGTKLLREYKDVEYHVTVLPNGEFEFNGKRYKSLTKIACDITGTWISGPAFFGLTQKSKRKTA